MSGEDESVRPTKVCVQALELSIPPINVSISSIDHALVREAQRIPAAHAADGVERILAITDRIWFKVKTGRWRGAAIRLQETEATESQPFNAALWWLGAGGYRREGDPADFYTALTATFARDGNSDRWLPSAWDWKRLELEHALAWERGIRRIVRELIARSLKDGHPYQASFEGYSLTALARAREGETYLAVGTENVADPRVFAVIINAVPGISSDDWLPEPGGVAGLDPGPGEVIWSTILPPDTAAKILSGSVETN